VLPATPVGETSRESRLAGALLADAGALPGGPLNPEQALALRRALVDPLLLLWGPPGTGKTRVLAATARAVVAAGRAAGRPARLLVATAAYAALDKLLGDVAGALEAPGAAAVGPLLPGVSLHRLAGRSARPLRDRRIRDTPRAGAAGVWLFTLLEGAALHDALAGAVAGAGAGTLMARPAEAPPARVPWQALVRRVVASRTGWPPVPPPGSPGRTPWAGRGERRGGDHDRGGPPDGAGSTIAALGALLDRAAALGLDHRLAARALRLADRPLVVGAVAGQLYELARLRADAPWRGARWFDVAVLDEASQLRVADAATLFCTLRERARLVVAGDVRQLGPVRRLALVDPALPGPPGLPGPLEGSGPSAAPGARPALSESVFGYLQQTHGIEPLQLTRNYRTNEAIAAWPRRRFYGGRYVAHAPRRRLRLAAPVPSALRAPAGWPAALPWSPRWAAVLDPGLPVVVLTYPGQQHALSNAFEARVVAALALLLRRHLPSLGAASGGGDGEDGRGREGGVEESLRRFWAEQLAVVTPHRAQRSLIANLLVAGGAFPRRPAPRVETVDAVQGQEREVVLASYCASDPDFIAAEAPFLLDPRRFNVTLTRARSKFVALMSDSLLRHLPGYPEAAARAGDVQLFVLRYCRPVASFWVPHRDGARSRSVPVRLWAPAAGCAAGGSSAAPW
jgi:hypothetical protein